jgi:hypothetical protein
MLKLAYKLFEGIFAMLAALTLSQAPLFMQCYTHQLSGRVAELRLQSQILERAAGQTGKNLAQYIQKFLASTDTDFRVQGQVMQGMVERYQLLSKNLSALQEASVWERPLVFFKTIHWEIAQETLHNFQPGLVLSIEGAIYAFVGMALGFFAFYCLRKSLVFLFTKKKGAHMGTLKQ